MSLSTNRATGQVKLKCDGAGCLRVFISPNGPVKLEEVSRIFDEACNAGWRCSAAVGGPDLCPPCKAVRS